MLPISFVSGTASAHASGTASRTFRSAAGASAANSHAADVALISPGSSALDLWKMNAGVDKASFQTNALSTANDAIGVIAGLLQNVKTVLTAADPVNHQPFDRATDQLAINGAVTAIDAIASSAQFGGKALLNGSFNASNVATTVSLPSFKPDVLGTAGQGEAKSLPLASLAEGGANDLSSGNLAPAAQIVSAALAQVTTAQTAISGFTSASEAHDLAATLTAPHDGIAAPGDDVYLIAAQMLGDPLAASTAIANSMPQNALALLQI